MGSCEVMLLLLLLYLFYNATLGFFTKKSNQSQYCNYWQLR